MLDVACGIGRWSDAITKDIELYCGVDFCSDFIEKAKEKNLKNNRYFFEGKLLKGVKIRACDIDTYGDYQRAIEIVKRWK